MNTLTTADFTTTLVVDQTPREVFQAITNMRGWWSEEIEGVTDQLHAEFNYHYADVHRSKMRLIELIPDKKVVWLVLDNYFNFTKDKSEWKDTKLSFEISEKNSKTQIRFTHIGLEPEYECFDICSNAWTKYIQQSLFSLITTGKGQPNAREDYHISLTVNKTPQEVFRNINNVKKWWTEDLEGSSEKLNDEFTVRFGDVHISKQKLVEFIPDKKVVWLVTESKLNFIKDQQEWNNTRICFELTGENDLTILQFTHFGLVPGVECYKDCTKGWDYYIKGSLFKLLTEGKGMPG